MSARSRLLTKDEELGKRDDDFKPRRTSSSNSISSILPKWRKRRFLIAIAVVAFIYLFFHHIPVDLNPGISQAAPTSYQDPYRVAPYHEPAGAPPRDPERDEEGHGKHYYNGVVRFYKLAQSLHKVGTTMGNMLQNRNVLFVASTPKSAANLIPMACEMAKIDRNYPHFAIFGRSPLSMDEILEINGVDMNECKVYWHDARGDYAEFSSEARAESATRGAMKHIRDFVHPQAIIMDDSKKEDDFFSKAMKRKAKETGTALIEIPSGKYEEFLWMTRLDAGSLSNWHKPNVEILIHAPPESSGSLIRLLKSLYNAEYKGLKVPRLTIELPAKIEPALQNYLGGFMWPPWRDFSEPSGLNVRHRIPSHRVSSEQASIRFVESFYPSNSKDNHVLIISPQAEMSPLYLQYLHFSLLEYYYQHWGSGNEMMGISLDLPKSLLNGKDGFKQPTLANMTYNKYSDEPDADQQGPSPFLHQAVSSTATLIAGEKWTAFHDYLSKRIQASHSGKTGKKDHKIVPETEPAWVEFFMELARARSWTMLHPPTSFVTIHNELAQIPEEFSRPPKSDTKATEAFKQSFHPAEEPFLLSNDPPEPTEHTEADPSRDLMPLHQMLPFNGELQDITSLPWLNHEGTLTSQYNLEKRKNEYVPWLRAAIGGCQGADASRKRIMPENLKTDDLFCLPGVEVKFADGGEEVEDDDWAEHVAKAIADSTESDDKDEFAMTMPTHEEPVGEKKTPESVDKDEAKAVGKESDVS